VATFQRIGDAGVSGMAIALPSYLTDFEIFREEVLPRMEAAGMRASPTLRVNTARLEFVCAVFFQSC
jgi:hypothetical protein